MAAAAALAGAGACAWLAIMVEPIEGARGSVSFPYRRFMVRNRSSRSRPGAFGTRHITIASTGQTCTHSSQTMQACRSSVKSSA